MPTTKFQVLDTTWTCEPFIDEDGTPLMYLGMYGDDGEYARATVSVDHLIGVCKGFSDTGARLGGCKELADRLVEEGTWTVHKRDAYLIEKCRSLVTRFEVTPPPASPG